MKKLLVLLVFLLTLSASCAVAESRTLVVYFSMPEDVETVDAIAGASIVVREGEHLGNVQFAAGIIARETGADLFRIETVETYPLVHDVLVDQAAQEQDDHFRPTLADHLPDLSAYDTILLGYPNWWADLPMALYTFLEQTDLSGKTVIPFTVHGGSGFSDTVRTIARLQPQADVRRDGLSISRNAVAGAEEDIAAWARGLGLIEENERKEMHMDRPYVICHMLSSLDGHISGAFMRSESTRQACEEYGRLRCEYDCDATLYGTITAEEVCAEGFVGRLPRTTAILPRTDYVAQTDVTRFVIAVDAGGQLAWNGSISEMLGRPRAHVIVILTESVSDAYLCYLRGLGISYIFAGKEKLNCALALHKLGTLFPIRKLMLAGGGVMNGSMLREGLVDELSIVLSPTIEGDRRAASLAEYTGKSAPNTPAAFSLVSAQPLGDALWLRYLRRGEQTDESH